MLSHAMLCTHVALPLRCFSVSPCRSVVSPSIFTALIFCGVSCQNLKGIYEELNKDGKKLEVETCVVRSNFIRRDLYYTRYNK